jgi:disulfide bond formation protein DsbB
MALFDMLIILAVLIAMLVFVVGIMVFIFRTKQSLCVRKIFSKHAMIIIFAVSFISTTSSLIYSELLGFEPCTLCWWQRIAMYPIVFMSAFALQQYSRQVRNTILTLSGAGVVIAVYHYIIQLTNNTGFCLAGAVDCATIQVNYFGFLSIPLMSATAFAIIFLSCLARKD